MNAGGKTYAIRNTANNCRHQEVVGKQRTYLQKTESTKVGQVGKTTC